MPSDESFAGHSVLLRHWGRKSMRSLKSVEAKLVLKSLFRKSTEILSTKDSSSWKNLKRAFVGLSKAVIRSARKFGKYVFFDLTEATTSRKVTKLPKNRKIRKTKASVPKIYMKSITYYFAG
jgi:hypothetical protein